MGAAIEAAGPDSVSAFIAEPVTGAASAGLSPGPDYWARVQEICRTYGVLMIADEIMTGFGRTGRRFGFEHVGWEPDIVVSGKGLGGGYVPISLVASRHHVTAPIEAQGKSLMYFTYSGHDSACAAAICVLEILERENLVALAARRGDYLRSRLDERFVGHRSVTRFAGRGLMLGLQLHGVTAAAVVEATLALGLWVYPCGSGGDTGHSIMVAPPLIITEAEIDELVDRLAVALDAVQ